MGRDCKGCGEPTRDREYWCSDACWHDEDGGWDDGPADDGWTARTYERQAPARSEGHYDGWRLRY